MIVAVIVEVPVAESIVEGLALTDTAVTAEPSLVFASDDDDDELSSPEEHPAKRSAESAKHPKAFFKRPKPKDFDINNLTKIFSKCF